MAISITHAPADAEVPVPVMRTNSLCAERACRLALSIGDWVWEVDRHWRITYCSSGVRNVVGYSAEELSGKMLFDLMAPTEAQRVRDEFQRHASSARALRDFEHISLRADGAEVHLLDNAIPYFDESGAFGGYRGVTRDITHRKRSEQLRDILTRELQATAEELKIRNEALEEANSEIETFIYAASHDLRSPLINLVGFTDRLSRGIAGVRECLADQEDSCAGRMARANQLLEQDVDSAMTHIHAAVERFEAVISGLLQLSRTGRELLDIEPIDMHALVNRVVSSCAVEAGEREVRIDIGDLPPALGDANAVGRVWSNLIGNAIKFLDPDRPGHIEIGCRGLRQGWNVYFVRDNGVGIEPRHRERIFRVFQRLTETGTPGDGLGLAIVRKIVSRHGGKIEVDSAPGKGSTFSFTLEPVPAIDNSTAGAEHDS
jgi:PAS domain S-box-containing protein